jgi:hypothetical protein
MPRPQQADDGIQIVRLKLLPEPGQIASTQHRVENAQQVGGHHEAAFRGERILNLDAAVAAPSQPQVDAGSQKLVFGLLGELRRTARQRAFHLLLPLISVMIPDHHFEIAAARLDDGTILAGPHHLRPLGSETGRQFGRKSPIKGRLRVVREMRKEHVPGGKRMDVERGPRRRRHRSSQPHRPRSDDANASPRPAG